MSNNQTINPTWNPKNFKETLIAIESLKNFLRRQKVLDYDNYKLIEWYLLQKELDGFFHTIKIRYDYTAEYSLNFIYRIFNDELFSIENFNTKTPITESVLHISFKPEYSLHPNEQNKAYRDFYQRKPRFRPEPNTNSPLCFRVLKAKLKLVGVDLDTIDS
jgi:hypothetical protein